MDQRLLKLLLDKDANRYAQYQDGNTSLDLAVKAGHHEVVDLLKPV